MRPAPLFVAIGLAFACACSSDEPLDSEDEAFIGPKADGFCTEPDTAEADGVLALVNAADTTFEELDDPVSEGGAGLNRRAVESIFADRPFATLTDLDRAPFLGVGSCQALVRYACDVKELCAGRCEADAFTPAPPRTAFTSECADLVLALPGLESGFRRSLDVDAEQRCVALSESERLAFDAVADQHGVAVEEFHDEFGDYQLTSTQLGDRLVRVEIQSLDSGLLWLAVTAGNRLALLWSTDGLAAGTEWYCGVAGTPAPEPSELCVEAALQSSCGPDPLAPSTVEITLATAAATLERDALAGLETFAADTGLGSDTPVTATISRCGDAPRTRAVFSTAGGEPASYEVVENNFGLWVISSQLGSGDAAIRCERFDHSFCGGATDPGCPGDQVCDVEPGEAVGFCRPEIDRRAEGPPNRGPLVGG